MSSRLGDFAVFGFALYVLVTFGGMRTVAKAGYPGWLVLFVVVPVVDLLILLALPFLKWPVERRLEWAEQRVRPMGQSLAGSAALPGLRGRSSLSTSCGYVRPLRGSWDPVKGTGEFRRR